MADRAQAQRNADREAADRAVQRKQQLDIATAKAQQNAMQLQQKQLFDALNVVAGGSGPQADAANAKLAEMAGLPAQSAQQKDATWNSIGQGLMNALGQALQGQTPVANTQQSGTMQPNANAGSQITIDQYDAMTPEQRRALTPEQKQSLKAQFLAATK